MMKTRVIFSLALALLSAPVAAQNPGLLPSGSIVGNSTASTGPAVGTTMNAILNRNFGSTANQALVNLGGTWQGLPSANNSVWATNGSGVPSITGTLPSAVQANITGLGTVTSGMLNGVPVTGLSSPTVSSDAATKGYVDSVAVGLNPLGASRLATAAVLPNTPTYSNGASGVGATLTAGSNTTLTVDGVTAALNDVILVKDQAAPAQNGQYYVSAAGSGAAPWVLTRCTVAACGVEYDNAATIKKGSYTFISAGSANANKGFIQTTTVATVGTDAVSYILYAIFNSTLTVGSTPIVSGTTGRVLYDNGSTLGEYSITGTGSVVLSSTPSISGGTLDNSVIGGTTPNTGRFTHLGIGTPAPSILFSFLNPNSSNGWLYVPTMGLIADGQTANPVTTYAGPSIMMLRTEAINDQNTTGATNALVYMTSLGNNISTVNNSQTNVLALHAEQITGGQGDALALFSVAVQNGNNGHVAFGGFFQAIAGSASAKALAIETSTVNNTGTNAGYDPITLANNHFLGFDIDYSSAGSNYGSAAILVRAGPGLWDVGIAFYAGSTRSADLQSNSSTVDSLLLEGSYIHAINIINATTSSFQILAKGFTVDPSGVTSAVAYKVGATAGVTCGGSPTGSFATVNGIVTHC